MLKDSRIYVSGHGGLVGSALLRRLRQEGFTNILTATHDQLDLRDQAGVNNWFEANRPEYVFLAAAKVGGILANDTYKAEFIYDNLMIATNVIHAAYKYDVKKLLNLGSSCIYPKLAPQPMKEDYLLTGSLEPTNEPYAIAKITAIKLCRYYNEQYGTNFISVMPTNLYGPHDNFNLETDHVLPALIRKFHLAKLLRQRNYESIVKDIKRSPLGFGLDENINLKDESSINKILTNLGITAECVLLWGSGEPYREFLYIDDLAEACVFLMEKYDHKDIGEFINIGAGQDIKIKDLAHLIKQIIGFEGEIKNDPSKPDGAPRKLLDITRLKALGWTSKTDLTTGIKNSYENYLENCY